jgi:4-hydroxybenzoate polyprenyltransferase
MNTTAAFFKLVRWPNLLFIALTQVLFRVFIIKFVYSNGLGVSEKPVLSLPLFYCLVLASIFIAAAGYVINDYFDINIDLINKPSKIIVDRHIKRRWAIVFHIVLSFIGFVLSCFIGYKLRNIYIPVFNLLSIIALWFYSTTFKKKLLIGNVLISLLTAWVILVLTFAEHRLTLISPAVYWKKLLKLSFIYAGFAFIISLVREVIKDMEDTPGDAKHGCTTMPIIWGMQVSKVFVAVWLVVLIAAVSALQIYILQSGWWFSAVYSLITIIIPLVWVLKKLYRAHTPNQFHELSAAVKFVMFTGILSMVFF